MNRLSQTSSLYLRQHAGNPVAWHPWDERALTAAREDDRPILLSIGYSACHWCHVMAHECFEDPSIAALMNELYVNVKVDREERPDLDKVYQLAHQLLTGRGGGWPLTVFLEPRSLAPFFAGTYFPPRPRHGMPAFPEVLEKVRAWFDGNRDEVLSLGDRLQQAIGEVQSPAPGGDDGGQRPERAFETAAGQLRGRYDERHGGFGGAPKFPQAPLLAALPAIGRRAGDDSIGDMLHESLRRMARGGLRDHLDGGFFRYTVDGTWTIPHFEKMLYDNAMLLPLYAEAARRRDDAWLRVAAEGIADWMTTHMRRDNGGFSSSVDADAEGEEGGFHVWQRDEVRELLDADEYRAVSEAFGLDEPPNFEGRAWHLAWQTEPRMDGRLEAALEKLRRARDKRVPPGRDDKQLASWNALAVEGFVRAGRALDRTDWLDVAEACHEFLASRLWIDGTLYAVFAGDGARFPAYLDDYAFLLQATLELLGARWKDARMDLAVALGDALLDRFHDSEHGGFYFTAAGEQAPLQRLRILQDDATPGGNAIAARALLRLGHLAGESRFIDGAGSVLDSVGPELGKYPLGHASVLVALDEWLDPPAQAIITGRDRDEVERWFARLSRHERVHAYAPDISSQRLPRVAEGADRDDATTAHVCVGVRCLPPIHGLASLEEALEELD